MLKKGLFGAGAAVLLLGLLFGRDAFSYVATSYGWLKSSVKDSVPITFEIDRARKMIKNLEPEIRHNMHLIAKEEVGVDQLEKQLAQTQSSLDKDRVEIKRMKGDLETQQVSYKYAGRNYTAQQVKTDLSNRFERFKTSEATADKTGKILTARKQGLVAARQKLEGMLAAKRQLEVDVENLEARLKMVEVAQTSSEFNVDDSSLARTKDLLHDIGTRIEVSERLLNADTAVQGEIPLDEPEATSDICDQVSKYFGEHDDSVQVADAAAE